MQMNFKTFLQILGSSAILATVLLMYGTFLTAYFHPSKSTVVYVNVIGEANFELIMTSLIFIYAVIQWWKYLHHLANQKKVTEDNQLHKKSYY